MVRMLLLAALALALLAPAAAAAPALPLGHSGRWITDDEGRVVVLHGYNLVSKRPPYAPDALGFGSDDAAFLAAEGYNTVRVGINYAAVEPRPGVYDDAYLNRIAATVALLARHGIVSLLGFHQDLYTERFQGRGFPDWAVIDDGLPAEPKLGVPANYLVMPALWRAFDHFWANDPAPDGVGLQDHYAAAWRHVAERFRDNDNVLGYELLNEPWPGTLWPPCANPLGCPGFDARLTAFTKRAIAAIREVDSEALVFYEPNLLFSGGAATRMADVGDGRAGFAFHDHCSGVAAPAACGVVDELVFRNAERRAQKSGDALLLTEAGATSDPAVLTTIADRADRFMLGWQMWHYCACEDPSTVGAEATPAAVVDAAEPPEGDNVDAGRLQLLTRPYPRVVAGTPREWSFGGGVFRARWSRERVGGGRPFRTRAHTEIVVPRRQFPLGYVAEVVGGRVRSRAGAPVLRVVPCPGATEVSVTVRRAGTSSQSCRAPALRLRVVPRDLRARRRTQLVVGARVREDGVLRHVAGALVHVLGRSARTGAHGQARFSVRFPRPGVYTVTASAPGHRPGRRAIAVRR